MKRYESPRRFFSAYLVLLLIAGVPAFAAKSRIDKDMQQWRAAAQWRSVTAEELAMTDEAGAPGASAIYLYTNNERSDVRNRELIHRQIKVLTDEGRNLANVSINYEKESGSVLQIEARVIQPDGTIMPFSGEIYDRPFAANREVSLYVRSFTLPDVRVGSVIEYRYWRTFSRSPDARWFLNQGLFTRLARYSLELSDNPFASARWSLPTQLPEGVAPPLRDAKNVVSMEARNMPAFVMEDYMPPPDDLITSVDFSYTMSLDTKSNPVEYWRSYGEQTALSLERYIGDPKGFRKDIEQIVAAGDSNEQKVRKIYEHVRTLKNTEEPDPPGRQPQQKCKLRRLSAREVGRQGCGATGELQMYFIALVRAAGIAAVPVQISSRRERLFTPETMDSSRLNGWLVAVTLGGREQLLEPGLSILPFGMLTWWKTAVPGLKLDKAGAQWLTTPLPAPADATTRRKAKLTLSDDGVLEGTVVVSHSGHEAIERLAALYLADEPSRADFLKRDLQQVLAVPADITVVRQPDWRATGGVIEVEYRVKVSQWALPTTDRMLLGVGLFGAEQIGKFVAAKREHPIYFAFPFLTQDDMEISLPAGYRLQNTPAKQVSPDNALKYVTAVESRDGVVSISRSLTQNVLLAKQVQYSRLRSFYDLVRSGDQEQVILVH